MTTFKQFTDNFNKQLAGLTFTAPVAYVYNPLEYAQKGWLAYCEKYGATPKEIMLVGMNPGPWGMAQTGVPFGDVPMVTHWLGINANVSQPANQHPKRPVMGFASKRSEVSGTRVWGWAKDKFGTPQKFFKRFFVANYCPLVFYNDAATNITPDKIKRDEKQPLLDVCDAALRQMAVMLKPKYVVGVGKFAEERTRIALQETDIICFGITHPSPANPKANRGWAPLVDSEFAANGVNI